MSIILASKSPRRQELLKLLGLEFTVHTADIDEHMDPSLPPEQEVARVSAEKARAVAKDCAEENIIISADTIVVIDGQILGKPKSEADAIRMLNLLSGRRHEVMTGLTVLSGGQSQTQVVRHGHRVPQAHRPRDRRLRRHRGADGQGRSLWHSGPGLHLCQPSGRRLFLRHGASGLHADADAARARRHRPRLSRPTQSGAAAAYEVII